MASIPISADDTTQASTKGSPPHRFWTFTEGRAMFELGLFYASRHLLTGLPKGDGHAVMCLPGFMASNNSTVPMRGLLRELGYDAHGWDSGRNIRIDNALVSRLEEQLIRLYKTSGRKVSIIGWSLGGVIAREIAKLHPDMVRSVISLGSPISSDRNHTHARALFERLNGKEPEPMRDGRFLDLETAPAVPTTSVYTKTDGIVHWHASIQAKGAHPSENIEVHASHCGLGVNPSVMVALADRLSQAEGEWKPFAPKFSQKWMFPRSKLH